MDFILEGSGVFIYPLGLCSFLAVFVMVERFLSLRRLRILPNSLEKSLILGVLPNDENLETSSLGRIVKFYMQSSSNPDAVKAFASLEITRLERGMFLLDTVISAAPLLGLLGTVAGLVSVFSDMPTQESIARGVALALSTTLLGLSIAIPSILASSYLYRKIDTFAAALNICTERLTSLDNSDK